MYKPALLLALLSKLLVAGITLQVSSETAPPGGYAQFKISLTAPALVTSGSVTMDFDPAIFGNIASVAAFSATGDQSGYATPQGLHVLASFTSLSASFGQLPGLPIFVVTVPVLSTAKIGATSSITVDPTHSPWLPGGTVNVNPGTFTVGGTLSIQSVTPGGGLLPAGTIVAINGTGFDATTTVTIDGVSLASTQFVNPQQINVTLGGATEMNGKHVHVANAVSASVDHFAALPGTVTGASGNVLILPFLPSPSYTAVQWLYNPEAPFAYYNCLQNPNSFPVTAIYYTLVPNGLTTSQSVVIPPYGQYISPTRGSGLGEIYMTASAPILMAQVHDLENDITGNNPVFTVSLPIQVTSLGVLGLQLPSGISKTWSWQVGTPAPQPQIVGLSSGLPFTVSISGSASPWLSVTPASGSPGFTSLILTPVVSNLAVGIYTGTVILTPQLTPDLAQFAPGSVVINVAITVTSQPQLMSNGGTTVPFSMTLGGSAPLTQTYPVTTNGNPATFAATVTPNSGNWLSVTPASGTAPATLTLAANPAGLAAGTYQSGFIVQGPINTLNVAVTLTISDAGPGNLVVAPTSLTFSLTPGQAAPAQPQLISVHTPTPPITVTASGGNWLTASLAGTAAAQVNATAVNLGPGTYQGTVTITSPLNLVAIVPVTLVVAPPPGPSQLAVAPSAITLTAPAGQIATGNLSVTSISGPGTFTIMTTPEPLNLQFQITPDSPTGQYTTPSTIQLSASAVLPGTYQQLITFSWNGGSAAIPVTLFATATPSTPPVMAFVTNSGSAIQGSISPGELITIFGSGLLGGTEVLINGTAAPVLYTSTGQVNAIVPYEVTGTASVKVIAGGIQSTAWDVPVAASAPSIFTFGATGVGQGAIVNQDGSINSASNPAIRGTAVQIYSTGGGQTSPSSSTGSVAKVAANLLLPVTVTIGGVNAQVLYAGAAPGEISGVVQINAIIPQSVIPSAALPVMVTIGGVASQTATAAVH